MDAGLSGRLSTIDSRFDFARSDFDLGEYGESLSVWRGA
jgi:hypothetical protein